ncbi:MAG: hypothetical protein PHP23_08835, partial [Desulfobacterales bacterium]|nr:hypothetical protein [Desulfobacterales bacterium]
SADVLMDSWHSTIKIEKIMAKENSGLFQSPLSSLPAMHCFAKFVGGKPLSFIFLNSETTIAIQRKAVKRFRTKSLQNSSALFR